MARRERTVDRRWRPGAPTQSRCLPESQVSGRGRGLPKHVSVVFHLRKPSKVVSQFQKHRLPAQKCLRRRFPVTGHPGGCPSHKSPQAAPRAPAKPAFMQSPQTGCAQLPKLPESTPCGSSDFQVNSQASQSPGPVHGVSRAEYAGCRNIQNQLSSTPFASPIRWPPKQELLTSIRSPSK